MIASPEILGILGLTWQEKVSSIMQKELKPLSKTEFDNSKKAAFINNINALYVSGVSQGVKIPTLTDYKEMSDFLVKNRINVLPANAFIKAVYSGSISGEVPLKIYDPRGAAEIAKAKTAVTGLSFFAKLQDTGKKAAMVAAIGAGVLGYMYVKNIINIKKRLTK
jgi:hypothetical protein